MFLELQIIFILFLAANIQIIYFPQAILLNIILPFLLLLFIPGQLMLKSLDLRKNTFWESLSLSVGISTALLMILGLIANFTLPIFGIVPLSKLPILMGLDSIVLVLFLINFSKYKSLSRKSGLQKINIPQFLKKIRTLKVPINIDLSAQLFTLVVLVFPILSIFGVMSLNNLEGNYFTMALLGGIGILVLLLTFFKDKLLEGIFPTSIYFVGLSLLLMTSLRGFYITGHDVQFEYYIFHLTKSHQFWNIEFYKDAYNACLSITVLPTILSNFFTFNDVYIYKVVFQVIFAFCPVIIYFFLKKYTSTFIAFISAFYFLTFPTFLNDMPMLNRQEIAFLFLSLLFYILFIKDRMKGRLLLLIMFGFGVVTSHYSTNYIATFSLILTYIIFKMIRIKNFKKILLKIPLINIFMQKIFTMRLKQFVPLPLVLSLIVLTLFWNVIITKTSGDLVNTTKKAVLNIGNILNKDNKSVDTSYSLFSSGSVSDEKYLDNYIKRLINDANEEKVTDFYDENLIGSYTPDVVKLQKLPLTNIGLFLEGLGLNIFSTHHEMRQMLAKLIQVLIVLGLLGLLLLKTVKTYDAEYVLLCFVSIFLIALMVIMPGVSVSYGLLRLFQQALMLFGLPIVLGTILIFGKLRLKDRTRSYIVSTIAIIYFLNLSGFLAELTGGYYPELNLRNEGIYYNAYYVHKGEAASIDWLSKSMEENVTVQSARIDGDKLWAYGNIPTIEGSIPQTFRKSAYVYVSYINTATGNTVISVDRSIMTKYPTEFLDQNKNLIYTNGQSKIYR